MKEKFYVTTAIAYASRTPHIGNVYEAILTDCIARYKRMMGFDVFFLTGTDEHGQKIQDCAAEKGIEPKEYVDAMAAEIRGIWDMFGISYNRFIRTTDDDHVAVIQHIFEKLYKQGDIYKSAYEGNYCKPCESFWTDTQVVDGCCPTCGAACTRAKEEAYFLKLSNYSDKLLEYYKEHDDFIVPVSRKNEMINNFFSAGLQDLCVSRTSFSWGIPVTFNPGHVVYVWIDALSNYITAIGYDTESQSDKFKALWPADLQVIGKDIVRFHTIYWPIMLMALGLPLPKTILGHPWLLFGNDKMSKSKGNVIYGKDLVEQFGVDAVRHYLLSEMSFANDGSITYESIIRRTNSDLANTLGNLVSRTAGMISQYFGGKIPEPAQSAGNADETLVAAIADSVAAYRSLMDKYHVADACEKIFVALRACNKYIDETTPWLLAKDESKRGILATVLANLAESIRICSLMFAPFVPQTSHRIAETFGFALDENGFDYTGKLDYLCSGNTVKQGEMLFARIDEKKFFETHTVATPAPAAAKPAKEKPAKDKQAEKAPEQIDISDFAKVSLRVGKVLSCEAVPKSDKLLVFKIDLGTEVRQIVSGIAKFYSPDELIGKKLVVVENLKPVVLRGVESCGMLLTADSAECTKLLMVDDAVPVGSKIR